jgi:DNA polymerase-3 subunit epsilon
MPLWYENTLLSLDLETTGLNPLEDRIVQAAVLMLDADGSEQATSWHGIVDPGIPIPVEASRIHGITTERAQREGMPPEEALRRMARLIHDAADRGFPLVIYNAPFDWPFVLAEAQRHGVSIARPDIVDPLVIDRAVDRYRRGSRRLDAVAAHYGHDLGHAHDARADAIAAAAIARAVGARYPKAGDLSTGALQPLQGTWHAKHAESLARHLGKPIDAGWPLPSSAGHLA